MTAAPWDCGAMRLRRYGTAALLRVAPAGLGARGDHLPRPPRNLRHDGAEVAPQPLGLLAMGSGAARDLGLNSLEHLAQLGSALGNLALDVVARHVGLVVRVHSWRAQPQECDDKQQRASAHRTGCARA